MSGPTPITADLLRTMPLPIPEEGGKESRGRVFVVAGSVSVPGAALLAGEAALRAGAGKLQVATSRSVAVQLGLELPEARVIGLEETGAGGVFESGARRVFEHAGHCDSLLIGPGMTEEEEFERFLAEILRETAGIGLVLDAAALANLPAHREALKQHGGRFVITPHSGEMAKLLDRNAAEIEREPLERAREAASLLQAVVVMKGSQTHIVSPGGEAWLFDGGTIGLGTSGSGDVLAGVVAGLLARGATPLQAALWAVYLHGESGRRLSEEVGLLGFLAREISGQIPRIMAELSPRA